MPEEKGGYDAIGNPKTYDGWAYTWKAGRMLESMKKGKDIDASFTYDHTGLRVQKVVNGVTTSYIMNGKKITHAQKGSIRMHFFYDAQGRPSLIRYNGVDYAYLHNLQGDVVGMIDMDGTRVVEYTYDAWGKPQRTMGGLAATLGKDNPFRYRGYVWDEETGLYYLRSRYYDPQWGRFLNADVILGNVGAVLSHNMVAYCVNNPVNMSDLAGEAPIGVTIKEGLFALLYPVQAISIGSVDGSDNISSRASRFAIATGLNNGDGSQVNAIRHATWVASMATAWGTNVAGFVETAHESTDDMLAAVRSGSTYDTLQVADTVCDVRNNAAGFAIANNPSLLFGTVSVDMQSVALDALAYYHEIGLHVAQRQPDGRYKVVLQKLTDREYVKAATNVKLRDKNGNRRNLPGSNRRGNQHVIQ